MISSPGPSTLAVMLSKKKRASMFIPLRFFGFPLYLVPYSCDYPCCVSMRLNWHCYCSSLLLLGTYASAGALTALLLQSDSLARRSAMCRRLIQPRLVLKAVISVWPRVLSYFLCLSSLIVYYGTWKLTLDTHTFIFQDQLSDRYGKRPLYFTDSMNIYRNFFVLEAFCFMVNYKICPRYYIQNCIN